MVQFPPPGEKPGWLKTRVAPGGEYFRVRRLVKDLNLNTVCREARCPNAGECFSGGTATFLILGDSCTRDCRFCAVNPGVPCPPDPDEPDRVARGVGKLGLRYAVITSVTRDDLSDGGAGQFVSTVRAIRSRVPGVLIETLVSDFGGRPWCLDTLIESAPDVISHNLETVPSLYAEIRPGADYRRSLDLLARASRQGILTKSGLMLGLGESEDDVLAVFRDLRESGCDMLTLGQYLRPTARHVPVRRYLEPEIFRSLSVSALKIGFRAVAAGPLVRSSFKAHELFEQCLSGK